MPSLCAGPRPSRVRLGGTEEVGDVIEAGESVRLMSSTSLSRMADEVSMVKEEGVFV